MNNLKQYRRQAGLTQAEAAEALGVSTTQISRLERGENPPNLDQLHTLARLYKVPIEFLVAETRHTTIVIRGSVEAGVWKEAIELPRDEQFAFEVPPLNLAGGPKRFGLLVKGQSMNIVYPEGSILDCVQAWEYPGEIKTGLRVIVRRVDAHGNVEGTVKEVKIDDDGKTWLLARSTEPQFQTPIRLDDGSQGEVDIIAIVVGSYRPEAL